jgi:hypothetical protein
MACALRSLGQKSVTLIFDRLGGEGGACSVLMVLFTFYANLGLSNPLCSRMPLFWGGGVFSLSPFGFRGASFFIGGLFHSPLHFRGCLFFRRRSFFLSPCVFWVTLFLLELFFLAPCILGVSLFSSEVFFEPMSEIL